MKLSRRIFVAGAGVALAAAGIGWRYPNLLRQKKPNLILFIADDMRFDAAGFTGNRIIQTPHLDRLAAESCVFDNHFVTSSVCCTSRASIMSGEYALKHNVYGFSMPMRPASMENSFFRQMRQAGYYTGFIGKWGIGGIPPVHEFHQWQGYSDQGSYYNGKDSVHLTDRQTYQALKFLQTRPVDRPFLLIVAYKAPHGPSTPQPSFANLYADVRIPRAESDTVEAAAQLPKILQSSANRLGYRRMAHEDFFQKRMKQYYQTITGLDESIGKIISEINATGVADDTSLMFTSDNGLLAGEHGLFGKWCMYEESIRTPLMFRPARNFFPDIVPSRVKAMSLNIDIPATILSASALSVPANVDGKNLLPLMYNPVLPWRKGFYYEHPSIGYFKVLGCIGYRSKEWKYTRYFKGREANECLFHLADDPLELNNLAENLQYAEQRKIMEQSMMEERQRLLL